MRVTRREWLGVALAATALGCPAENRQKTPPTTSAPSKPLRVLVVDAPAISAKIQRFWSAKSDEPLELSAATVSEALTMKRLAADVVLYPSELLGTLAEAGLIAPLPKSFLQSDALKPRDILGHARWTEVNWGEETFAVSLGSPTLTLYYRTDLLERLKLDVPRTWDDYTQLGAALSDRSRLGDGISENWAAIAEPLASGWAGKTLLARVAAYARHRNELGTLFHLETMEPQLEQPPFVKSLEALVAAAKHAPASATELTPTDTRQLIYAGRCALAWSWPTATAELGDQTAAAPAIGIAQLPGASEVYNFRATRWEKRESTESATVPLLGVAGVLASITTAARAPRAAEGFLAWLSCSDETVEILPASPATTAFRERQLDFPQKWCEPPLPSSAISQYVNVLRQTNDQGLVLVSPRLPGCLEYLAALDKAVHAAIQGTAPAEALQTATRHFQEITTARGLPAQRLAYHRSLGLDS